MNPFTSPQFLALLIPILVIVFGGTIPAMVFLFRYLRRRRLFDLYHQERMAAIEKGMEVPCLPEALLRESGGAKVRRPGDALLKGLIWLFVGGALFVALRAESRSEGLFGLIPIGVGMAYLIYYIVEGRRPSTTTPSDLGPGTPVAATAETVG